ncbi:MAG: hypothetical protein V4544_02745 [Pseudomonadota bacterium]
MMIQLEKEIQSPYEENESKRATYRLMIKLSMKDLLAEVEPYQNIIESYKDSLQKEYRPVRFSIPLLLQPDQWKDRVMLEENEVETLHEIYMVLDKNEKYCKFEEDWNLQESRKKSARSGTLDIRHKLTTQQHKENMVTLLELIRRVINVNSQNAVNEVTTVMPDQTTLLEIDTANAVAKAQFQNLPFFISHADELLLTKPTNVNEKQSLIGKNTINSTKKSKKKNAVIDLAQVVPTEEWLAAERIRRRPEFDQMLIKTGINFTHGSPAIQEKLIPIYENKTIYRQQQQDVTSKLLSVETEDLTLSPMHFYPRGSSEGLPSHVLNASMLWVLPTALKMNTKIRHLHLNDFQLESNHFSVGGYRDVCKESLADAVTCNQNIQTLHLTNIHVGCDLISHFLVPVINGNKSIHTIEVHNADVLGNNKEASTQTIHGIQSLQKGALAAALLANILQNDETILKLGIGGNGIGDAGAISFAQMLNTNHTLVELELSNNWIGDVGVEALVHALYKNKTLKVINLGGNEINEKNKNAIEKMRAVNTLVKVLI